MKKKIDENISDKELKKKSIYQVIVGRPIADTLEILIYLGSIIFGIYVAIQINKYGLFNLYWKINSFHYFYTGVK